MIKALIKANNDLINWCNCEGLVYATSGQADCPWCGCGWLFSCIECRKAFTFARVVEIDFSLSELSLRDQSKFYKGPVSLDDEGVRMRIEWLENELEDIPVGTICAILDGKVLPVHSKDIAFNGFYARHELKSVPQWNLRHSRIEINRFLGDPDHWIERELPKGDDQ